MRKCSRCDDALPKNGLFVVCRGCDGELHYECSSVSEKTFKSMSETKRANWRCYTCKGGKDAANRKESVTDNDETTLEQHFAGIKKDIERSQNFLSEKYDELLIKLEHNNEIIASMKNTIDNLVGKVKEKEAIIDNLHARVNHLEQYSRNHNFEIAQVQEDDHENLEDIVLTLADKMKIPLSRGEIEVVHRLPAKPVPIHITPVVDLDSQAASLDQFVPAFRLTESGNGANGFMLVGNAGEMECISHNTKVAAGMFDILSNNSEVDHPLCEECTDTLLDLMDKQLKLTEEEWHDYSEFLQRLKDENEDEDVIENLEKELENLKCEEQRLTKELSSLQKQEQTTETEIAKQEAEKERLDGEEERYWREYTRHRRDLMLTEDDYRSLECQLHYAQAQLDKLKKTNVFNATFHIWHSGHFGTINNFRLGRLPSAPVDWSEINAAWGQTALLLTALARKMNLTFERFRVVPYGNHSYIEVLSEHKELPLYGSGGFRFLWDTKFDAAMVAFLDCLQQFKEEVEKGESGFCLPYRMERGKIEDSATGNTYSIKIQFNSEEQWTKALKFLLTNLKWGLAWVSSQFTLDETDVK